MSRPSKIDDNKALCSLENAFWNLLERMPYEQITIKALASEAGVNHNTLYYHFKNMDEMAQRFFKDRMSESILPTKEMDLSNILRTIEDKDSEAYSNWQRVTLFTCRGSDVLETMFRNALRENRAVMYPELRKEKLNDGQRAMLEFMDSGIIDLIAYYRMNNDPSVLENFMDSKIAKAIRETISDWCVRPLSTWLQTEDMTSLKADH